MTAAITAVRGRRVWDSRGHPTVEAEVTCGRAAGRAIAPAGASTGSAEAVELRDGGATLGGRDVRRAVEHVNTTIAAELIGREVGDQRAIDDALVALDPDPALAHIGANAVVATSLACAHAAAAAAGVPLWQHLAATAGRGDDFVLPLPEIQIFGGGAHAGGSVDIQDFLVMAPGADSFATALDWTAEIYAAAGDLVGTRVGVADEGGWWPAFDTNEAALEALATAVERAGFTLGGDVVLALDIAASELWDGAGGYRLDRDGRQLETAAMIDLVDRWCTDYHIASVEDPLGEHDAAGLTEFTARVRDRVQVVGDDVYVTNADRIATMPGAGTALLVKVNQAGTLSRAADALDAARAAGLGAVVSARSGESEDVTIVHLALGWGVAQLKVGSITRGERTAKWNEMLRVEEALGRRARFAGWDPLPRPTLPDDLDEEQRDDA